MSCSFLIQGDGKGEATAKFEASTCPTTGQVDPAARRTPGQSSSRGDASQVP